MTGYRWRRKGTPSVLDKVVSVTWRGGGKWSPSRRLASSSIDYTNSSPRHSSKRPIRDTLTFSRENETFHSAACTPFPSSFDRSIPLADIGSRATLPLLDKFAFQLVIAQHDSLLRTHPLRPTPFTFRLSSSQLYFWRPLCLSWGVTLWMKVERWFGFVRSRFLNIERMVVEVIV